MRNASVKTGNENIHQNIVTLRHMLKMSQLAFIEAYLSDDEGRKLMSNSKYSNFERFGAEDSEEIAKVVASKIGTDVAVFQLEPEAFISYVEPMVKSEEKEDHSFATGQNSQVEQLVRILSDYISNAIMEGD